MNQIVHALESLLELSRKLPAKTPVARFTSLMRFSIARAAPADGANENRAPASPYRRRSTSRHGRVYLPAQPLAERGRVGDGEAGEPSVSPPRSLGGHRRRSRFQEGGRTAGDEGGVSFPDRRGSTPPTSSRKAAEGDRSGGSWSPASNRRGRARSEDIGSVSRGNALTSEARPRSVLPTEDPTTGAVTNGADGLHPEMESRPPRSRGPSLPSVSVLVANACTDEPGTGGQESTNIGLLTAQDGGIGVDGAGFTEENGRGESKDGFSGFRADGTAGTLGISEADPFENELLGEATILGRGRVREAFNVGGSTSDCEGCRRHIGIERR